MRRTPQIRTKWCKNEKCGRKKVIFVKEGCGTHNGYYRCEICRKKFTIADYRKPKVIYNERKNN